MSKELIERLRHIYADGDPITEEAADCIEQLYGNSEQLRAQLKEARRMDFREMREMLRAMQAGELTVSRGIEILEMWNAGNWNDDMLPPVRQDLIEEDAMPVEIIDRLNVQLKEAQEAAEFNFQQYQDAGRLLCEAQAEIEKLKAYYAQVFKDGERQIQIHKENAAASQANEVQLREALYGLYLEFERTREWGCLSIAMLVAKASLSLPSDTTALEAIVQKAGEVMRERCWQTAQPDDSYQDDWFKAKADSCERIRALPGVTVEDLK